jgi:hypothetical protein
MGTVSAKREMYGPNAGYNVRSPFLLRIQSTVADRERVGLCWKGWIQGTRKVVAQA